MKFSGPGIENRDMGVFLLWALLWAGLVFWGLTLQGCSKKQPKLDDVIDLSPEKTQRFYYAIDPEYIGHIRRTIKKQNCMTLAEEYATCQDVIIWDKEFNNLPYEIHCFGYPEQPENAMLSIVSMRYSAIVVQTRAVKDKVASYESIRCEAYDPHEVMTQ